MELLTLKNLPTLPFQTAEAINQLRVNLSLCGKSIKTIMITSTEPNEGKSFICMNLLLSMARSGSRVLLIDCDLRNSTYRSKYGLSSEGPINSIVDVLAGRVELQDAVYRTSVNHAYIMPVITTVPNPAFLLENGTLKQVISQCRDLFDYVIVDTPPAATVADALRIAPMCDGSVIVVRSGVPDRKAVYENYHFVSRASKSFLGFVLNRIDINDKSKGYYHRYGYGGYYGNKKNENGSANSRDRQK